MVSNYLHVWKEVIGDFYESVRSLGEAPKDQEDEGHSTEGEDD